MSIAHKFADAYVRLRAHRRMSLSELSHDTGIAKSRLSSIQNCPDGVSLVYADRIARALGSSLSEMIDA